eukprot:TRINITY_DN298_c0_g1_i13.p1 TRINITY_DN298_c0_g1~~TRINITY_DN298_c0_g1_i13.p1  ORF type:complete len:283 (+),score=100.30 TRINITY_DN298_c0_g1_i13:1389-2237(+)
MEALRRNFEETQEQERAQHREHCHTQQLHIERLEASIASLQQEFADYQTEVEECAAIQVDSTRDQNTALRTEVGSLQANVESLQQQLDDAACKLESEQQSNARLVAAVSEMEAGAELRIQQVADMQVDLEDSSAAHQELLQLEHDKLCDAEAALVTAVEAQEAAESEADTLRGQAVPQNELDRAVRSTSQLQAEIRDLLEREQHHVERGRVLTAALEQAEAELREAADSQEEVEGFREALAERDTRLASLQDSLSAREAELRDMQCECDVASCCRASGGTHR